MCGAVLAVLAFAIPETILRIYTDDLALVAAAVPAVYVIGIATIVSAVSMNFFEAVSGTGNTAAAMALEFGVLVVYILYIYLMTKVSNIAGVWTAELVYNVIIGIVSFVYIKKANWTKRKL